MQKTIVVRVDTKVRHPLYGKIIKTSKKFKAHDEHDEAKAGDKVIIIETRPLSKDKCWRLLKVVEKASIV
ncbi:MAG: 30S ribosomal protein S17 [Clostridiales bacterium]|nr:30S ribosomal protein S17 [Clostridiales bacterium]